MSGRPTRRPPSGQLAPGPALLALALILLTTPARAHPVWGVGGGFTTGFMHPITGPVHVIAMVAVGMWGLGAPALWLLPMIFPLVMAGGGLLGVLGVPLPGVQIGLDLSAVGLGAAIALAARPPVWVAAVLVGGFAVFHGYSHGVGLPSTGDPGAYSEGFMLATALLHLCGIAFGLLVRWALGEWTVRATGGLIACAGLYFLIGI